MNGRELAKALNKQYGNGTVINREGSEIVRIPTGIFNLDAATGGGVGKGRFTLLVGKYGGGKTLTALKTVANGQLIDRHTLKPILRDEEGVYVNEDGELAEPMRTAYLDPEGSVTFQRAEELGVDTDPDIFTLINIDSQEQAFDIIKGIIDSGQIDIIVLDSLAAMAPEAEIEKSMSDATVGVAAKANNRGIRIAQASMNKLRKTGAIPPAVILVNQIRQDIGSYGNPNVYPGGVGQNFASSLTVEFRPTKPVMEKSEMVGRGSIWKIAKNKLNGILTEGPFVTYVKDVGIYRPGDTDAVSQVVDVAVKVGLIQASGPWYTVNGERLQGKGAVEEHLMSHPDYFKALKQQAIDMTMGG